MRPSRFWPTALLAAVVIAGLLAVAFPYGSLGIETLADRQRAWLLTVWTVGVMAICFGVTGLLAVLSPISFRDISESVSVTAAIDAHREVRRQHSSSRFFNGAGWTVTTGFFLLLFYFGGWFIIGR
jgi:hypothetical protein